MKAAARRGAANNKGNAMHNGLTEAAIKLFGDGQPRPFAEAQLQLGRLVPPGEAVRRAEGIREARRGYYERHERVTDRVPQIREIPAEQSISTGRKSFATTALQGLMRRGFVDIVDIDGLKTVVPKRKLVLWKMLYLDNPEADIPIPTEELNGQG